MMKKIYLFHIIIGILLFSSLRIEAQNYVASGGEMGIFGSFSFATSTFWATDRTATPGYYSWTAGTGNYTDADDIHHINGYVKKYGSEPFVFPVGSGTDLRTLSISAPSSPTDAYAVAWIVGNPSAISDPTKGNAFHPVTAVSDPITGVSTVGQWDWQTISGTGEGLLVTVSIPQLLGTDSFGTEINDASQLRLVGWNGTTWENLGNAGASGIDENSLLSGIMKAGIQAIGIGAVKGVPIGSGDDIIVYNAVAPDGGNPLNAQLTIENIEKYPDNTVIIFDRWGNKVYETSGYNLSGNVFKGEASGNTRYKNGTRVDQDTYFYVMKYRKNTTESYRERSGYLYLKRG